MSSFKINKSSFKVNSNFLEIQKDIIGTFKSTNFSHNGDKFSKSDFTNTVKAFVVTPNDKKFNKFHRGYDKGYKNFYSRWKFICLYPNFFFYPKLF